MNAALGFTLCVQVAMHTEYYTRPRLQRHVIRILWWVGVDGACVRAGVCVCVCGVCVCVCVCVGGWVGVDVECACELVGMCLWDVSSYGKLVAHVYLWVVVAHVGCSSACGL